MFGRSAFWRAAAAAIAFLPFLTACGSAGRQHAKVTPAPASKPPVSAAAVAPAPQPAPPDPVLTLIAESEQHFKAGQRELEAGHVAAAKQEFDKSLGVLLVSQYGGRTEPRIRDHFDRLVDRISAYE